VAQALEPIAEGPGPDRGPAAGPPRQTGELEPLAVTAERIHTHPPKEEAVFPGRFMLGYFLIVLFFGALLIGFAVFWSRSSDDDGGATTAGTWSFFKPTAESEALRTRQIARFVGTRYQTRSGDQLVRILAGPPAYQDVPVSQFMLRDGTSSETLGADKAIMYILCGGTSSDCALPLEASSSAHERLVRREALELALYTMKYNGAEPVVVLMPPDAEGNPGRAILFRSQDLHAELDRPLSRTLPAGKPPSALEMSDFEVAGVDYLTLPRMFAYSFQPVGDGTARMVMNPDRPSG
jgi:hypothetical protein